MRSLALTMTDSTVSLVAEWARWGMDPGKRLGYHLLACSEGKISPRNFEEILDRFSPGSLYDLPQVTISYVPGDGSRYLGLAIHEAEASGADRLGRDVMVTRYFCVPYESAAAAAVSYTGLYEALKEIQPPEAGRSVVSVGLAGDPATPPADVMRALPVVGLLLTGNPVCIVGAEATEIAERLAFIEATMSLLPYGMRAEMAASTWTRGTYQRHKFRLFFSEAPRRPAGPGLDDHVVRWRPDAMEITAASGTRFPADAADDYVETLERLGPSAIAELAGATKPTQFDEQTSSRALSWVSGLEGGRTRSVDSAGERRPFRRREAPRIRRDSVRRGSRVPRAAEAKRVAELLLACLQAVDGDTSQVKRLVNQIEEILREAELPAAEHRRRLHAVFGDSHRLMHDLPAGRQRTALYQFLLRLSLSRIIDYEGYCLIEDILGDTPDGALLTAIDERAADDPTLKLLIADRLGARLPEVGLRELIELAADLEFRPAHARVVCGFLLRNAASAPRRDIRDALPLLREHGYLAPALSVREPDDLGYQVETLKNLLAAVYSRIPGSTPYRDVVAGGGKHAPTAALFLAVLCLTPESMTDVAAGFTASLARSPGLSGDVREALAGKGLEVDTTGEPPRPGSPEETREYLPAFGARRGTSPRETRTFVRRILNPDPGFSSDPPEDDYLQ
jgi:hypothetical protein